MFNKNDIKNLPFGEISKAIENQSASLIKERLASLQAGIESYNSRKIKTFSKDLEPYVDSEAGSDGLEEHVIESIDLVDPSDAKLEKSKLAECRKIAEKEIIKSFIDHFNFSDNYTWILPQMKAAFGDWKAVKVDGKYDGPATVSANCTGNLFNQGLWYIAQSPRSDLIRDTKVRMYKLGEFNHLVPLILNSFKIYQNIKYSSWGDIEHVVDTELAAAMLFKYEPFSIADLLDIRDSCLQVQTGPKQGSPKDPKTTPDLLGLDKYTKYPLRDIPKFARVMIFQIWAAHPSNRTQHMVLDPNDWDATPEALVTTEVLKKSVVTPWHNFYNQGLRS